MLAARWSVLSVLILSLASHQAFALDFVSELKKSNIFNDASDESSYCQLNDDTQDPVSGYRTKSMVRIASVSKIFTSFLATTTYGPFYRFQTKIYAAPVTAGSQIYDVHIAGGEDPYFNFDKMFFLVSELNRVGITQIRNLTFDSKLRLFLSFRETMSNVWSERLVYDPDNSRDYLFQTIPAKDTLGNLQLMMNTEKWADSLMSKYLSNRKLSAEKSVALTLHPKLSAQNISVKDEAPDATQDNMKVYTLSSLPLYRYLKDMNKYSINFIADQLFLISGGIPALEKMLDEKVSLKKDSDFKFYTGSGLPDRRNQSRKDNLASCDAVVKTLDKLAGTLNGVSLSDQQQSELGHEMIKLSDILLIAGYDSDATYNPDDKNDDQDGAVVGKTGTLTENPASNLAGYVSTKDGLRWFGLFLNNPWKSFKQHVLTTMINEGHGADPLPKSHGYLFDEFIPYDSASVLKEVVSPVAAGGNP